MSSAEREERRRAHFDGHEEGEDDDDGPQAEAVEDGAPGADRARPPGRRAARPPKATNCTKQEDAEHRRLWQKPQLLGAVEAGGADDGLDAVVEEQVGEQEQQRLRVVRAGRANVLAQLARGCRRRRPARARRPGRLDRAAQVAQAEDGDEGEAGPPEAGRQQADPRRQRLGRARGPSWKRSQGEVEREQDAAAEVAEAPSPREETRSRSSGAGDAAQERVVDDERGAEAEAGDDQQQRRRAASWCRATKNIRLAAQRRRPRRSRPGAGSAAGLRSAMAPTKMSTSAETIVATVTV